MKHILYGAMHVNQEWGSMAEVSLSLSVSILLPSAGRLVQMLLSARTRPRRFISSPPAPTH